MAVELLGSGNDNLDFGDHAAALAGTTLSFCFTLHVTNPVAGGNRLLTQWGNSAAKQSFLVQNPGSAKIGVGFSKGTSIFGRRSASAYINADEKINCAVSIDCAVPTIRMYINGVNDAMEAWIGGSDREMHQGTTNVQIGHETDEGTDGVDGDYSEIAMWDEVLSDDVLKALSLGFSPRFFQTPNSMFYVAAVTVASLVDEIGGSVSNTGAADATHPNVYYPNTPTVPSLSAAPYVPTNTFGSHGTDVPLTVDINNGAPSHTAPQGRMYWDTGSNKMYVNNNGTTGWTALN